MDKLEIRSVTFNIFKISTALTSMKYRLNDRDKINL